MVTAERPPNSLLGLHKRLLRIPQETSGTLGNEATETDETVPPYQKKNEFFERTSVYVQFSLSVSRKNTTRMGHSTLVSAGFL